MLIVEANGYGIHFSFRHAMGSVLSLGAERANDPAEQSAGVVVILYWQIIFYGVGNAHSVKYNLPTGQIILLCPLWEVATG